MLLPIHTVRYGYPFIQLLFFSNQAPKSLMVTGCTIKWRFVSIFQNTRSESLMKFDQMCSVGTVPRHVAMAKGQNNPPASRKQNSRHQFAKR